MDTVGRSYEDCADTNHRLDKPQYGWRMVEESALLAAALTSGKRDSHRC